MKAESFAKQMVSEWASIGATHERKKWPELVQKNEQEGPDQTSRLYTDDEIAYLMEHMPHPTTAEEAETAYNEAVRNEMPTEYSDALLKIWWELDKPRIRNKQKVYHCAIVGCHNTMSCASADLIRMSTAYDSGWICPECLNEMFKRRRNK